MCKIPGKETQLRVGQYDVTNVTKNSAQVGCTSVTREEVERLLAEMNEAKIKAITIGSGVGQAQLVQLGDKVRLQYRAQDNSVWQILDFGIDGIYRHAHVPERAGLALDVLPGAGSYDKVAYQVVKLTK